MRVLITLNTEKYQQNIGQLPDCFLHGCTVEVDVEIAGNLDEITADIKNQAISGYWIQAGGTGGDKRDEKMMAELFNFSII